MNMAMNNDLIKKIGLFLEQKGEETFEGNGLYLCRGDGTVLFHQNGPAGQAGKIDQGTVGALLGGVWQAAAALVSLIPQDKRDKQDKRDDCFRLSFDTSSRGIYVLPLNIGEREYYLATIFQDELNPAVIKVKMRSFLRQLSGFIDREMAMAPKAPRQQKNDKDKDYLFRDITDAELDKLFSFSGT